MTTGVFNYKHPSSLPDKLTPEEKRQLSANANMERVLAKYRGRMQNPDLITEKGKIKYLYSKAAANGDDRLGIVIKELNVVPEAVAELEKVAEARIKLDQSTQDALTRPVKNARLLPAGQPPWSALTTQGFLLTNHSSKMVNWDDEAEVSSTYYPEMMELAKNMTGATHVFASNHLSRETGLTGFNEQRGPLAKIYFQVRGAAIFVHNDFTEFYGEDLIQSFVTGKPHTQGFGFLEAMAKAEVTEEELRNSRMLIVNTWRPTNATKDKPCKRLPLAVADRRSVPRETLVNTRIGPPPGGHRIFKCEPEMQHDWFYYPDMTNEEVMLINTYDSEEHPYYPTLHTAFEDPATPVDAGERRSVELRVLCLIPQAISRLSKLAPSKL